MRFRMCCSSAKHDLYPPPASNARHWYTASLVVQGVLHLHGRDDTGRVEFTDGSLSTLRVQRDLGGRLDAFAGTRALERLRQGLQGGFAENVLEGSTDAGCF